MIDYEIHGSKGGAEQPHTPVETPNNLISVAYAKVLMAVAEGELAGNPSARDIYLDGTPLQNPDGSMNFSGVSWEWRSGTVNQEHIKGFPEVSTEYNVGADLLATTPWTRLVTSPNLDAVRVTIQFPGLMQQKSNGDTVGSSVKYNIQISTDGGPFVEYDEYEVTGKTNQSYERTHRVDLPESNGGGWTIRVNRLTPDSTSSTLTNKTIIKSYAEVIDSQQIYPHTALLYVEFDSRTFGGGSIPKISVKTRGRLIQVPANYDPETRTYSGIWAGNFKWAWSNNPAWVFYDMVTQSRFGLGHKIDATMVDKYALYEVAQYCDVMVDKGDGSGEKEPRHTCNIYIQQQNDAWDVLRDISNIFNGMTYWNGNQMVAIADKEESLAGAPIFSRSNVVGGQFNYKATDDKSIYTSALVSYDDPANHYQSGVEATWERSQIIRWGGDRQINLSAIGCTSRGEAQRRGKYVLLTNMFNRTVSFQTGLQGLSESVMPGKIIHVLDPLIGGKPFTGRVRVSAGRVVTLDRDTEAKAGDILYMTKKNGATEGRTVQSSTGNIVTVTVPYTEQPQPNAVWYLEAADLKSQLFRITKVTSPSESVYEIDAVEYNESKFAAIDNGARLEARPISKVPTSSQLPPTVVDIRSATYVEQTMAVTTMTISWPAVEGAVSYEVQWRVSDGDWVNLGFTGTTEVDVKGIYAGQYMARVRARNAWNISSVWTTSALTNLAGKEGAPPTIASLTTTSLFFGIRLDWTFKGNSEDLLKTEFMVSPTPDYASAIPLGDFAYPRDSHEMHGLLAGQRFWFWTRTQDRTGNQSEWYPKQTEIGIEGSASTNDGAGYNDYFAGLIAETALDKALYDRIELIDGDGPGSVNERVKEVNDRLQSEIDRIDGEIADITDSAAYDPLKSYLKGSIVRWDNRFWQAMKDVPEGISPPDPEYWKDVGVILEEANGVVTQVNINTQKIEEVDGKVVAMGSSIESLSAQWRDDDGDGELNDAMNGYYAAARITEERIVRASEDEALAQRIITVSAKTDENAANLITLEKATTDADNALAQRIDTLEVTVGTDITAAIQTEATVRANADGALGQRIDTLSASMTTENGKLNAAITAEQTARVNADTALGTRIDTVQASVVTETGERKAAVTAEQTARANADTALGSRVDTVQATTGSNTAAIQTIQTAQTATGNKLNAMWAVKMELNTQGQYVAAGIGLGIENGPAGLQSQFLVRADRFAVVNGTNKTTTAPFVVSGGQVFIADALINKATITNAVITSELRSQNYVANSTGIRINFVTGAVEINGTASGQGRLQITNNAVRIYHTNGRLAIDLGINV